jgi:hypothetical protein
MQVRKLTKNAGTVHRVGCGTERLVQGVGRRIELTEPPTMPSEALIGRIVVITHREGADLSSQTWT